MKRFFLAIICCLLYSSIIFAGNSEFPFKYNVKTKTGSGTVYADTKDVFNPTRQESITEQSGVINLPLIQGVTTAYQDFYLDALPSQGYGLKQWRKVDSSGTNIKIIGNTRKSKFKETLGNSESVFYYEADFEETMVSVDSETPNRCQVFISKEINQVGDVVTLTASTNANCNISWKKNGVVVSTDNPLVVSVTEKAHYTANASLMPASAKLANGYYRLRSAVPDDKFDNDYMKVADSYFYMSGIVGSARNVIIDVPGVVGRAQTQLKRDLNIVSENFISDPGTIVYISNSTGNLYDIYGQGIHVKELTTGTHHGSNSGDIPFDGCYVTILNNGGVYSLYANIKVTYSNQTIDFGNFYFGDYMGGSGKHEFSMSYADFAPNNKWFIEKVEGDKCLEPNFSNAVLSNNKEYTTLRLPFPSLIPEGSGLKAYSVTAYPSETGDLATLTEYGEGNTIPAGLPVVLERCNSNVNSTLMPSGDISSYDVSSATNSSGENSVTTALYNKYGSHLHDPEGNNQDQPTKGDGVGYFSVAYTGSTTLYKLGVNEDGVVGFWTPVANNETIYGNEAYATQPCALFPKEVNLKDLPTTADQITYKLVDPLTVAYVDKNNVVYAKDDNGAAKQAPASGEEDFMALHYGENTYVDHSNWVAIEANSLPDLSPRDSRIEATGKMLESAPNRRMAASRVDEIDKDGLFDYNTYSIVNLMPKSSHSTAHHNFFFAAPQANEIANIIWAQWDGNNTFIVPPASGFTGAVGVDFSLYNDSNNPITKLQEGHQYQFLGLIERLATRDASTLYKVYPLEGLQDMTGDGTVTGVTNLATSGDITSVKYYNMMGVESDVPFQGVNIVVTRYDDGSQSTHKLLK